MTQFSPMQADVMCATSDHLPWTFSFVLHTEGTQTGSTSAMTMQLTEITTGTITKATGQKEPESQ